MKTSASRARRWSMTTAGFGADVYLFMGLGLILWLLLPTLALGWSSVLITSGSMSPAIHAGDIVLINEDVTDEPFGAGTIITYHDPRQGHDRLVTHRIAETALTPEADGIAEYVTRGDANNVDDTFPVPHDQVVGSARLLIPLLGLPVHWARTADHTRLSLFVLLTTTAIAVATGTARRTAVAVRSSHQQLRRTSRFAEKERAVIAARATRVAQAAQAAGTAALVPDADLARHQQAVQLPMRATADGTVPHLSTTGSEAPTTDTALPVTHTAPPAQRGVGATWGPGQALAFDTDPDTDDEPPKPRLTPVAELRPRAARTKARKPARLLGLLLVVTITAGGASIPGTGAAFTATSANGGNVFSLAAPDPDPGGPFDTELVLPPLDGEETFSAGQGGTTQTIAFTFDVTEEVILAGVATASLAVQASQPGNADKTVGVALLHNGAPLAAAELTDRGIQQDGWTQVELTLAPELDVTLEQGDQLTVEISLLRLAIELDGPSVISLPAAS